MIPIGDALCVADFLAGLPLRRANERHLSICSRCATLGRADL
jgi:hypothetical protein